MLEPLVDAIDGARSSSTRSTTSDLMMDDAIGIMTSNPQCHGDAIDLHKELCYKTNHSCDDKIGTQTGQWFDSHALEMAVVASAEAGWQISAEAVASWVMPGSATRALVVAVPSSAAGVVVSAAGSTAVTCQEILFATAISSASLVSLSARSVLPVAGESLGPSSDSL